MTRKVLSTTEQAKAHGANVRAGRITFPSVDALEAFARVWRVDESHRLHAAAVAAVADPGALPLPESHGGPNVSFGVLVDAWTAHHNTSRAECFRQISGRTGNSEKGIALRYRSRPNDVWRFAG